MGVATGAIPAAAAYLVAHGAHDDLRKAVYAYNHAGWYVDKVLAKAAEYRGGDIVEVAGGPSGSSVCSTGYAVAGSDGQGAGPWGGHTNGRIPLDQLCSVGAGHLLRCDGAAALKAMTAAHLTDTGRPLVVTDAYRDCDGQVDVVHRKPHLAAKPGYSKHGWGVAVDLVVDGWRGPTFRWLQAPQCPVEAPET